MQQMTLTSFLVCGFCNCMTAELLLVGSTPEKEINRLDSGRSLVHAKPRYYVEEGGGMFGL